MDISHQHLSRTNKSELSKTTEQDVGNKMTTNENCQSYNEHFSNSEEIMGDQYFINKESGACMGNLSAYRKQKVPLPTSKTQVRYQATKSLAT